MGTSAAEKKRWTVEEYLEMERHSLDKHELFDGEIFLMAGAGPEHSLIVASLLAALAIALRGKCLVCASNMRVFVAPAGLYTYPDASVVCGAPELTEERPPALRNPDAIFEVLSESTESYDRGKKFESYRSLPSLHDYVLIAQDRVLVECFTRQPDGTWNLRDLRAGQTLRLPCGEIAVDDLYLQVPALSPTPPSA